MKEIHKILILGIGILSVSLPGTLTAQRKALSIDNLSGLVRLPGFTGQPAAVEAPVMIAASKSAEILKLLYGNRVDEAVTQSTAHLRSLVPAFLATDPKERMPFEQERQFVKFLQVYGLADQIVAALAPADAGGVEARIVQAAAAEMMGDVSRAMESYGAILEEDAQQHGVRGRLALLLVEHASVEEAVGVLKGMSAEVLMPLGQTFSNHVQSISENEYDRRLDYLELLVAYFEQMDPQVYVPADWLQSMMDHSIGQGNWGNTIRFGELYYATNYNVGYNNSEQEERSRKVEERRREVHDRLCQALVKLPQFAELGFQRLSGLATKEGGDVSAYERLAKQLLLEMPAAPERPEEYPRPANPYRTSFRENWVPFLSPAEFLLRSATDNGDYRELQDSIIPLLRNKGNEDMAAFLEDMIDLSSASGETFTEKALAVIGADYTGIELGNLMRRVMAMYQALGGEDDIGPLVLAYLKAVRLDSYQSPSYVRNYANQLASQGGDVFAKFIDDSAEAMLGPVDQQAALIENHYDPQRHVPNSPGNAIRNYVAFLGQMIQSPSTAAVPLKKAFESKLIHPNDYQIRNQISNNLRYYRFADDPQGVYQFLVDMGMLDDLDTIQFYPMGNISRETLFGYMFYNLSRVQSSQKDQVMAPILAHPKETFGKAILVAAANASSSSSSQRDVVTRTLEPFMEKIVKLPDERQQEFLYWYAQMISQNSLSSTLKRAAPKVAEWYEPYRNSNGANARRARMFTNGRNVMTLEGFLGTGNRTVLDQQSGLDYVANQVMQTFEATAMAKEMEPFIKHYAVLGRQPLSYQPDVEQKPNLDMVLASWMNKDRSIRALGVMTHLLKVGGYDEEAPLGSNLLTAVRATMGMVRLENPSDDARIYLEESQGRYDDRLTPFFVERFSGLTNEQRVAVSQWAAEETSPLGQAWREALALVMEPDGETEARWSKRLGDTERSLAVRMQEATIIGPIAVRAKAFSVVETCMAVMTEGWADEKVAVASEPVSQLLMALTALGPEVPEAVRGTRALLSAWSPHFDETPMSLSLVRNVLALDQAYGIEVGPWLAALPQTIQRQPGFLMMLLREASAPGEAVAAVPWSLVAMPPVNQRNQRSRRQVRYINGQRHVTYVGNSQGNGQLNLGAEVMDKALWDKMQAFLPEVEEPGTRYFAEMLISALPDGPALEGVASRTERLRALSERYDRESFASPYLAEHTVSWLCALNEGVAENTRGAVAHFGGQIDYRVLSEWYDSSLKNSRQGLLNHYVQDASKNDPDAFAKLLDVMLERADPHSGEVQQLMETYCQGFPQNLLRRPKLLEAEQAKTYLPLLRRLAGMSQNVHWNGRDECITGNFAMHVLANDVEGYQDWMMTLDESTRAQVFSNANLDQVVYHLRDGLNAEGVTQERRFEVLNGLFTGGGSQEKLFPSGNFHFGGRNDDGVFERMIDLNILKKEEILEHGPLWAEANPRDGAAYGELAKFQAEAEQEDEAILNYLQAVIHMPLSNDSAYGKYHLAKTQLLLKQGRIDAAMSWLEFLDDGRLDESLEETYEELIRQTRFQYLLVPERLDSRLSELRSRLGQDPGDLESWAGLAELAGALGHERMEASDYFRGLAFLKLSYYILHRVKGVEPDLAEELFRGTNQDLVRGLVAVGLGGKKRSLIKPRSTWSYHYYPGGLSGSQWRRNVYTMGKKWKRGRAPLGYGDGDESTILSYGRDKDNKPITGYFRMTFTIDDPAEFDELTIGILHDDGMIAYLNGQVLLRNNMPSSGIQPTTLAPESRGSSVENEYWTEKIKADRLVAGENVIAVEVHQNAADSSDFGFDLELYADAINASEVLAEVESGSTMKLLKKWADRLPPNVVELARAIQ